MAARLERSMQGTLTWGCLCSALMIVVLAGCGNDGAPADTGATPDAANSGDEPAKVATDSNPIDTNSGSAESGPTEELQAAREAADTARAAADARQAGDFAGDEYAAAMSKRTKARFAQDGEEWEKAARLYREAADLFEKATASARTARTVHAEAKGLIAEYDELRTQAVAAGVDPAELRQFDREKKGVAGKLGKGNPVTVRDAAQRVVDDLRVVVARAQVERAQKPVADSLLAELRQAKRDAQGGQVDRYASATYEEAMGELRAGEDAHGRGQFKKAVAHLERGRDKLEEAVADTDARKAAGESPPPIVMDDGGKVPDDYSEDDKDRDGVADGDDEGDEDGGIASDDQESDYDQVMQLREKLLAALKGSPKYDDGVLSLSYTTGFDFQDDCELQPGTDANVQFEGPFRNDSWYDEDYAFAGHTRGHLLHKAVFEDEVRIKIKVYFEFLVNNPQFQMGFMSNGKDFLSTNFGVDIYSWKKGKPKARRKPMDKKYRQNPNKWVLKGTEVSMEVRCTRDEGKKMQVEVYFRGKKHSEWETDKFTVGQVSFLWRDSRFLVKSVEITGRPSNEWLETL